MFPLLKIIFRRTLVKFFKGKLHKACENGNIEAIKKHIVSRSNVNAKNIGGWLPLHSVANSNDKGVEIAELLIANGADVNLNADDGSTPLHSAAEFGLEEVLELLIAKGADVNVLNRNMKTPLDLLSSNELEGWAAKTAVLLRKHGAKTAEELKAEGK